MPSPATSTEQPPGLQTLELGFWGVDLDVRARPADCEHLAFYFRDYRRHGGAPALTVQLGSGLPEGFVAAIGNPHVVKTVHLDTGSGPVLYEQFTERARLPTPLPPLHCEPLASRLTVRHGAAFCGPHGGAWCIRGSSRAGKSTLLLALLARGARFLTDDLVLLDQDGSLLRYTRPIGVRERTAGLFPDARERLHARARPIATGTGTTWMIHPRDLGCAIGPERVTVAGEVWLSASPTFTCHAPAPGRIEITYDPHRHLDRALAALAAYGAP